MDIFGKIFGSEEVITGAINGLVKLVYTDEEEADMKLKRAEIHIKTLNAYEPFKITQRFLALMFSGAFLIAFLSAIVVSFTPGMTVQPIVDIVKTFWVGEITLAIVSFYFGAGVVESISRGKK